MKKYSSRYPSYKPRSLRRAEKKLKKNLLLTIIIIFVIAFVLLNWGLPALIGGLSAFNKLKPAEGKVELNLEDKAIAPPVLNIPFVATNSATIKITGYSAPKSRVELYLDNSLEDTVSSAEDGSFVFESVPLSVGVNNIYGKTVDDKNRTSLASKTIRLTYSSEKPKLEVTEPSDGQEVKGGDKKVKVSGTTSPDSLISINGQTSIVNSDGNFSLTININDGDNTVSVVATSPLGNISKVDRRVKYTP